MTSIHDIIKDRERCITENIDEKYQSDVLGRLKGCADTVVFPVSTEEVSRIMKYAWENDIPVTPRGAGTNLVGSTVPQRGGIVLDVSRRGYHDCSGRTWNIFGRFSEICGRTGVVLSAGSGRKTVFYWGKYQYQCRRYAGCEIRCDPGLCAGTGAGFS